VVVSKMKEVPTAALSEVMDRDREAAGSNDPTGSSNGDDAVVDPLDGGIIHPRASSRMNASADPESTKMGRNRVPVRRRIRGAMERKKFLLHLLLSRPPPWTAQLPLTFFRCITSTGPTVRPTLH